jgi:NAD(P)-dependent dehydrogenase (short-subunit alcohol dehydrogenase family)
VEAQTRPTALITGGSRGIGAATAHALAGRGYDVALTYRNKAARADAVVADLVARGMRGLAVGCDITDAEALARLVAHLRGWSPRLNLLVLNASGGLEREALAADPAYPMRINRDAQVAVLDAALPLMPRGSTVVFVTSHWAHLYGRVAQLPAYEQVAESKHAGELALRTRQAALADVGVRLLIVTGDLIEGTITPRLLERKAPGLAALHRDADGRLPTAGDMGEAIAAAATDPALPSGHVVVIGRPLDSLPER